MVSNQIARAGADLTPASGDAYSVSCARKQANKAALASFVGTTVEWYDFYAYSTAAALVLGKLYFPSHSWLGGTLGAYASFWAGFASRPIGGIIFGHVGDRVGRKKALIITLLLMGLCTMGIGVLPTYNQIGVAAPVLLIVMRLAQGVAMGGEWGGAVVLTSEHAPRGKEILYAAFAQQGSPAGNLLATLTFLAVSKLPDEAFLSWGWRVPFLLSAVLIAIGLVIRRSIEETPAMRALQASDTVVKVPLFDILTKHKGLVMIGACACIIGLSATYFKTVFALSWAVHSIGFTRTHFLTVLTVAVIVQLIAQPFGAVLATRMNMRKAVIYMLLPELVALPLMFEMIATKSIIFAMIGMGIASIPHSLYYAAMAGILSKSFPAEVRYTGISLSYQICGMLFAGTTPFLCELLFNSTGSIWSVVALALVHVIVTLIAALMLIGRMRRRVVA